MNSCIVTPNGICFSITLRTYINACMHAVLWRDTLEVPQGDHSLISNYCVRILYTGIYPPFPNCSCEIFKKANSKKIIDISL